MLCACFPKFPVQTVIESCIKSACLLLRCSSRSRGRRRRGDLRDRGSGRLRDAFAARRNHPVFIAGLARGIYEKFVLNAGVTDGGPGRTVLLFNGERRETGVRLPCKGDSVIRGNRVQTQHGRRGRIIRDLRFRRRTGSAGVTAVTVHDAAENFPRGLALRELRFAVVAPLKNFINAFRREAHARFHRKFAVLDVRRIVIVHKHHRSVTARGEALDFDDRKEAVRSGSAALDVERIQRVLENILSTFQMAADVAAELEQEAPRRSMLVHRVKSRNAESVRRSAAAFARSPADRLVRKPADGVLGYPENFEKGALTLRVTGKKIRDARLDSGRFEDGSDLRPRRLLPFRIHITELVRRSRKRFHGLRPLCEQKMIIGDNFDCALNMLAHLSSSPAIMLRLERVATESAKSAPSTILSNAA